VDGPIDRREFLVKSGIGAASLAAMGLATACGGSSGGAGGKKRRIALSNSYIGNKWRIEMVNSFKAAMQMEPYRTEIDGTVFSSGNDVTKQSAQLSNLISERVDAILVNAASPTGLNGILEQAASRGILVVSFDNTVTTPKALQVNTDQYKFGQQLAQFLVQKLNGRGNVMMVTGVAGTEVDQQRNSGAEDVWKQHPEIQVVNRYTGMWDSSVAQRNTEAVLPSLPRVDGIWCQGGTDGVLKAFQNAGRPLPPTAGEAENGFRKFMAGAGGLPRVDGLSIGQPPYLVLVALELARQVLKGTRSRSNVEIPFPTVTSGTVKLGQTVFADLPDSFFTDFTDSGPSAVVQLCVQAAQNGTSCSGRLDVRLPAAS
jgi:ribose transport system substrate-binding protein